MTLRSHHLLPAAALCLIAFASCDSEKPFEINGHLDFPSLIPYGDTIIQIPSPDGSMVYLLDGEEYVDSCEIVNGRFTLSGTVRPSEAHFAQVGNDFFQTLVCIEPGEIDIYSNGGLVNLSGTPSNEGLYDTQLALHLFEDEMRTSFFALQDSLDAQGIELDDTHYAAFQEKFIGRQDHILDSLYEANIDNLASIYAVILRHSEDGTVDDFERAVQSYPDRVRKNPQILDLINDMRRSEQAKMRQIPYDSALFESAVPVE